MASLASRCLTESPRLLEALQKQFVVLSVVATPERRTDVVVSLMETRFLDPPKPNQSCDDPFCLASTPLFYNPREYSTSVFMSFTEYEESALKVGDTVTLQLAKTNRKKVDSELKGLGDRRLGLFGPAGR